MDGASKTLIGVLIPLTPLGAPRSRDARFLIAVSLTALLSGLSHVYTSKQYVVGLSPT